VVHYFGSKGGLFQAAMVERFLEQVESLEEVIAAHRGTSRDLLRAVLTRAWKHLMRPSTVDLMISAMSQAQNQPEASAVMLRETGDRWRRLMGAVLTAGVAAGEFRPVDVDIQARIIGAGLKGLAMGTCRRSTQDVTAPGPDALLAQYLDMLDHALAVLPAAIPVLPYGDGV
jgi:AcrR family transcriptional regulator